MNLRELLTFRKNTEAMTKEFIDINRFFPFPVVTDRYVISKSILKQEDLLSIEQNWSQYRNERYLSSLTVGKEYTILYDKTLGKTMMSNHEFEMLTNQKFIDVSKGDVLIFGIGLGLIIHPLLESEEVKTIDVVEIDYGLIDEIYPILVACDNQSKLNVIYEDAFTFDTDKMYDTIYFDIWSVIDEQAFGEMKFLTKKFTKNLIPGGWMDSWCSEEENYEFK